MTRIQPEYFMEVWTNGRYENQSYLPFPIRALNRHLKETKRKGKIINIALFLIKTTNIPLSQRLEARKVNKNLK